MCVWGRWGLPSSLRTSPRHTSQGQSAPIHHAWVGGCGAENRKPLWQTAKSSVQGVHHHPSPAAAQGGMAALDLSSGSLGDCACPLCDLSIHVHKSQRILGSCARLAPRIGQNSSLSTPAGWRELAQDRAWHSPRQAASGTGIILLCFPVPNPQGLEGAQRGGGSQCHPNEAISPP